MATYIVKPAQNIFDVALHLYGSIEGIFDLLMTNQDLTMTTDLVIGQELEYHEDFVINSSIVDEFASDKIVPSNSERHVYYKEPDYDLLMIVGVNADSQLVYLNMAGEGEMQIDWGDNTELQTVTLTVANQVIEHYFDNEVETRRIRIYGDNTTLKFSYLNTTNLGGALLLLKPVTVDEYECRSHGYSLSGLFLFEGTYKVDLKGCTIGDLLPLGDMSLQELNLTNVKFLNIGVLDTYLQHIVSNYEDRRACTVYLSETPSEIGLAAIETILGEEEWNSPDQWHFYVDGEEITV